jgi:hypothetical protein
VDTEYFDAIGLALPKYTSDLQSRRICRSAVLSVLEGDGRIASIEQVILDTRNVTRVQVIGDNGERRRALERRAAISDALQNPGMPDENRKVATESMKKVEIQLQLPEKRVYVFWLDPQLGYALVQQEERYEDGTLLTETRNSNFRQLPGRQVWVPWKSTRDYYTTEEAPDRFFKEPIYTRVRKVTEVSVQAVPDSQFVLNYDSPGTWVEDRGAGISYTIPARPADLDRAIDALLQRQENPSAPQNAESAATRASGVESHGDRERFLSGFAANTRRPALSWRFVVLLNVVALVVLGTLVFWRYTHRSRMP